MIGFKIMLKQFDKDQLPQIIWLSYNLRKLKSFTEILHMWIQNTKIVITEKLTQILVSC